MPKPTKQKAPKGSRSSGAVPDDRITDPRFANIQTDPRFRLPSKQHAHVRIDKRFARMLHDEEFSSKAKVDRYGRKLAKDTGRRELERFYKLEDGEDLEVSGEEIEEDEEVEKELLRVEKKYDPARDGGFSSSSDESSSEEEEDQADDGEEDEGFSFPDQQVGLGDGVPMGEVSPRLAVVNLDWDNIRAADLMAVFSSFVPSNGHIINVSIYPSEFGKERMEREEMEGPPKEIFASNGTNAEDGTTFSESGDENSSGDDVGEEDEEEKIKKDILKENQGEEFDSAKLRHYQLERLRYYYAVLTCSSPSTAQAIYEAVDGTEYLTSANFFDLRFIPDGVEFADDKPRDECEKIPDGYKPNEFVTYALQHSKVKLTWDADDGTRKEVQKRAFAGSRADIDENDLKAYLGSDSSEDERPQPIFVDATTGATSNTEAVEVGKAPKSSKKEAERQRMRALLGLQNAPAPSKRIKPGAGGPVGAMQITFSSGLTSAPTKGSVFENEPERNETTVEKYVRKEKERKARRKEKLKSSRTEHDAVDEQGDVSGDDAIHEKDNATTEAPDLGFDDPFFTAPADDKTATTALRQEQKRQKRAQRAADDAAASAHRAELELLMVDDHPGDNINNNNDGVQHFDINEIARAEKALQKKKKKRKLSAREKAAVEAKESDAFRMDVADERFAAVFERPEFAIDPSSGRWKGTEGMRALLEEGRRRKGKRGWEEGEGPEEKEEVGRGKRRAGVGGGGEGEGVGKGEDLQRLVERVKGKTKKRRVE
ncbi:NUC153 [Lasallia pustulata]|uniref:NUC153 n=1 Tax=Lasallia pustulata TaxID=136370 RepID=A0A1W5CZT0_9LECA|nr:NUC153 [Lasallia pustulata]